MLRIKLAAALAAIAFATAAQAQPAPAAAPPMAAPAVPATPPPSPETLALARQVALKGDFLGMIFVAADTESEGVVKGMGAMSPADHAKAAAITKAKIDETVGKLADAMAPAYASMFTPEQLRAIDAFQSSPTGQLYARSLLTALSAMKRADKGSDLTRDMKAATCAQMGKGCPEKPATPAAPPASPQPAPKDKG